MSFIALTDVQSGYEGNYALTIPRNVVSIFHTPIVVYIYAFLEIHNERKNTTMFCKQLI